MSISTQISTQEHISARIHESSVIDATSHAKRLNWNTKLIIETDAASVCVDDLTGKQSPDARLRKLVIAAFYAVNSGRKRFELPVIGSNLNLTNQLLEITNTDGFTIIDLKM